jgi:hypothetical protein
MLEQILPLLLAYWPIVLAVSTLAYLLRNYFYNGLNKYPGPVLARFTNWWRFQDVWGRRPDITHLALHRQHGDVVRLGPNVLSFASPAAIKTIYGLNKGMTKSGFYPVQQSTSGGKRLPSLFSTTDEQVSTVFVFQNHHDSKLMMTVPCQSQKMRLQCIFHVCFGTIRASSK